MARSAQKIDAYKLVKFSPLTTNLVSLIYWPTKILLASSAVGWTVVFSKLVQPSTALLCGIGFFVLVVKVSAVLQHPGHVRGWHLGCLMLLRHLL
jgi:hypothetical protein